MPRFEAYLYGNIPIEGEITKEGEIESLCIPWTHTKTGKPIYLDYTEEERVKFEIQWQREISVALEDWFRQVRQEKKHGRPKQ